jgi:hypothetical protein
LLAYKALYGHLEVPVAYIIGEDDERYPEEVRGMKLGSIVNNIWNCGHYADHRNDLHEMGFLFERQSSTFEDVKLAYKSQYGHLEVPQSYIIGEDDERYTEEVRGMKLGSIVSNIFRTVEVMQVIETNFKEWDFSLNGNIPWDYNMNDKEDLPSKKSRQHC